MIGSAFAESTPTTSEQPIGFTRSVRSMTLVSPVVPEPVDFAALLEEAQQRQQNGGPYWFAIALPVKATPQTDGMWEDLDAETMLWRIPVVAPGALSLSLGLSRYHMPPGGRLFIYSDDHRQVAGPYTSRDNAEDGELDTPTMAGDSIIVELMIPLVEVPELELELGCVNYGFRPFGPAPTTPKPGQIRALGMGDAAWCNRANDAACYEETWGDQMRSVGLCELRGDKWSAQGTGTLLNNTAQDDKPYFLTAFHVVDGELDDTQSRDLTVSDAEKKAIERMFVYWNFQARTCGDTSGSVTGQYQAGARFVAGYWNTDFALLELKQKPPAQANVYYAGWDRRDTVPSGGVAIHHPQGDLKKVGCDNDSLMKQLFLSHNGSGSPLWHGMCFRVGKWEMDTGTTEPGSSGCSFFALPGKRTVGQLIGSSGSCDNPGSAVFGPLYRSWSEQGTRDRRLSDWLDPGNTGVMYLDGKNPSSLPSDLEEVAEAEYPSLTGLASGSKAAQDRQKQAVQELGLPLEVRTKTGIVLRLIPAGTFTMGSPAGEPGRDSDEGPQHSVTLTKSFYCGKFEVTQGQWQAVMEGNNPSNSKNAGLNAPVENVSWDECQAFLKKLCQIEGVAEGTYRLLTEAEWEYACRAGTTSAYYFGDNTSILGEYAWYSVNSGGTTHPVDQKKPNALGLHDMHGNVWEWCQDWYASYPSSSQTDPLGPVSGGRRVYRGGSWYGNAGDCRSAFRDGGAPDGRSGSLGLRLARIIP